MLDGFAEIARKRDGQDANVGSAEARRGLEDRPAQQHEPNDQRDDHHDVDEEAKRLRFGAERVEHYKT